MGNQHQLICYMTDILTAPNNCRDVRTIWCLLCGSRDKSEAVDFSKNSYTIPLYTYFALFDNVQTV